MYFAKGQTANVGLVAEGNDTLDHDNDCIIPYIQFKLEKGIPQCVQMPDWNWTCPALMPLQVLV